MKKQLIFGLYLLFSIPINSLAQSLDEGLCLAEADSKVYLNNPFNDPYPREVIFSCLYHCMAEDGLHEVQGLSRVMTRNQNDDGKRTVCQGVYVRPTRWGFEFDRVEAFYIYESRIKELRNWAKQYISRDNPHETRLLEQFKHRMTTVIDGYHLASLSSAPTASSFATAAEFFEQLVKGLPYQTEYLDQVVDDLKSGLDLIKDDTHANLMVVNTVNSELYWRF